jgi:hypothetical protein
VLAIASLIATGGAGRYAHADDGGGPGDSIDQDALFRVVGAMYGVDPELLAAIAQVESAGDAGAVSPKGAVGLMQLMPETALRYDVADPRDPIENVLGAARFLLHLRRDQSCADAANGSMAKMLAAYNAGEGAVCRWGGVPPYAETRDYVGRVLWVYLTGAAPPRVHARREIKREPAAAKANTAARPRGDLGVLEQLDELRHQRMAAANSAMDGSTAK